MKVIRRYKFVKNTARYSRFISIKDTDEVLLDHRGEEYPEIGLYVPKPDMDILGNPKTIQVTVEVAE